jgi:uncharacterized protein YmfQ (DUF2313 family)
MAQLEDAARQLQDVQEEAEQLCKVRDPGSHTYLQRVNGRCLFCTKEAKKEAFVVHLVQL